MDNTKITIAYGDGIGPEIMSAVLHILKEAEAHLSIQTIEIGEQLYNKNYTSGISEEAWNTLERSNIILKSPITTPQGGGYKSLNVTLRKALSLYANVRPSYSYFPFIKTHHPNMHLTIIRENDEDLYSGIEYRHTHNMFESVKLISKIGSEKIIRFAFEYAKKHNRRKVSCFSKDNIMKFTDGIFHKIFDQIALEYPNIDSDHYIVDIGTAKLATNPEMFDVIVTTNLYGDIISDIAGEISGSVGLAGSANIGVNYALFEAVHGSAPNIAGKNIANPSGLLNAAIMMLVHMGQDRVANIIENAFKKTLEDGIHTADIYNKHASTSLVGTKEFAEAVIKRLGQNPKMLKQAHYIKTENQTSDKKIYHIDTKEEKTLVGVDIFVNINVNLAEKIAEKIEKINFPSLKLKTISAKGLKLWPEEKEKVISDHWCCRFISVKNENINHSDIVSLLKAMTQAHIDFIKVENLYEFDHQPGFSLAQGE